MKTICIYHRVDLDTDKEIWKDVIGQEGFYQVSNLGRIRSLPMKLKGRNNTFRVKPGIVLNQSDDKDGYLRVALRGITTKSHRLVAIHFIDNSNNLPEINHKDLNKQNNCHCNLEWSSRRDNFDHSKVNNKQVTSETSVCSIKVLQLDKNDNILNEFNSFREAEKVTGISNATISKVANGIGNTAGGYKWKLKNN